MKEIVFLETKEKPTKILNITLWKWWNWYKRKW